MKDYEEIQELSTLCKRIISEGDGFTENTEIHKQTKKDHTVKFEFYDTIGKKIRQKFLHCWYDQLATEGLTFKLSIETYTVKLSDESEYLTKKYQWEKDQFDLNGTTVI